MEGIPQGLKPIDSMELIGTTEVVPFYKTFLMGFFIKPGAKARSFFRWYSGA